MLWLRWATMLSARSPLTLLVGGQCDAVSATDRQPSVANCDVRNGDISFPAGETHTNHRARPHICLE